MYVRVEICMINYVEMNKCLNVSDCQLGHCQELLSLYLRRTIL